MKTALWLALTPALFAAGRLELFHAPAGLPEQQVTGTFDMQPAKVDDFSNARFRIRNVGDAAVTLTKLLVAGSGFSSTGSPSLPYIVAPGTNVDFTVRFSPPDYGSYSALLYINGATYVIRAVGEAAMSLIYNGALLRAGDTIDFGRVERGGQIARDFLFRNSTREPLGVSRATLTGPTFFFPAGPPTPYLQPGESAGFGVIFRATTAGVFQERLTIDRREFILTATVYDPPLPRPTLSIESAAMRSGQQGRVAVRLSERARTSGAGTIRLELIPSGAARDNDEALRFVRGTRTVEFRIQEGADTARFGAEDAITFQTGTTAGTIVFIVEAGGFTDRSSIVVEPETVRLENASAVRGAAAIDVRFNGFDNTRSIDSMSFNFHLRNGQSIPVRAAAAADFNRWWTESKLGGMFSFRASFPVTGDISQIAGVDVEVKNGAGVARTERLTF